MQHMNNNHRSKVKLGRIVLLLLMAASALHGEGRSANAPVAATRTSRALTGKVICLDPGHGGTAETDGYRVGPMGEREEWINLRVAKELKAMLEARGASVVMTRMSDTSVALKDRAMLAIGHHADLFLSIHHNATADTTANFPIVYFHGNASENRASIDLGRSVIQSLARRLFKNRTPVSLVSDHTIFPESGAAVLRHSYGIPGIISEASFFTNGREERRLKDSSYNHREAEALLAGLTAYFSRRHAGIRERYSLAKIPPFRAYQESARMGDTARFWHVFYLKAKKKFNEGTMASRREAFRLFAASARSFPDSYAARDCHRYLSLLAAARDTAFSRNERLRVREFYVRVRHGR